MDNTYYFEIRDHRGIVIDQVKTSDIEKVKEALMGFEYELGEKVSGVCDDNN